MSGHPNYLIIYRRFAEISPCDADAECSVLDAGHVYECTCYVGYAGNGYACGNDTDQDGYPDVGLLCNHKICQKVS